ncbi:ankyrin-2-like isoform X3 [Harmonia axyridis]|uniref:ankyrin-2-like isoform X3 n=1 Tax=Harmonia axyridis TaxID=115357 RepID=UPI001E2797E7|nr:ankyrin-2-like isoform X3 [Harmonia axyridis]
MAQFVTHIQPTLVEASHHHLPHHYKEHKEHKDHDKHHKDYHSKDHHSKDHQDEKKHGKSTKSDHHHRHESNAESLMKDTQVHQGHPREFPVLPHTHPEGHHHDHSHEHQKERKRDSGSYVDSHGNQHTFQLHFVDSQGIHRDYHGHAIDDNHPKDYSDREKHKEKRASVEDKSPLRSISERPTPPKFIDLHSVHSENKISDGNTSFLRAARNGQLEKVLEYLKTNIDINTSNANGLNALHLASKDGHVEIVEELLKRGAIVDAATKKGNTALHIASLAGQEEVVKLLVQHGASVNVQSQNGFTPLYMAAQENHDNVVKFLLANGANQSLSTEDGFTPLAVAMQQGHDKVVTVLLENDTRGKVRLPALHIAAKKDDVRAAKLLLENDHNPDVTSKSGFTPLHIASHYGNQPIANLLIQKGADVNYSAKHNITPLHVAAKWGKSNMVSLLLEQGAHIEARTRDGLTPLHCAARSGHEQVVDMLLEKSAPISSKTKNGLAPLHMAAQGDHVDAARILLYHRAPVDEVTVDYLTALHVAAHCGHVRVAKLLLDRQADANARALNGFTPLHIACKKNRIKVVELLLNHGACIGATTESGLTPLHVASFMGCMNIVIYLLQHDASPDIPTVRGETPLHLAARANQTDIIRILLRNGAQVDARAREQQTPLHVASRLGNVDIVMLLLQHGAKIDNTTKDMYTSLHIAAKEGQDEVAAVLIENGASLNPTTKKGFTPLHLASKYGHLKVAKLLVQKEAPVDAQGKNGVTPLHVASHYDHQNVALLLLEKGASPHAEAKNGHTPLHIAARKNQMDIANTLLEYGAKPDVESKAGFTPLHLSSQEGHVEISSLLLEHNATPDFQSKNGLTPMHLCAQENKVSVAELLHKNGAEIDKQTKGGYTPLHIASHYGQADMVKFLLSKGANVKATTSLGYTPLHQAAQQGHTNIVNLLLDNSAQPNAVTNNGQTPLHIAQKLGYITVIDTLKKVTETAQSPVSSEEKYRVVAPELMHETFLSDSEEEGEDTLLGDQTYRYLTADEMKSLGDDSLPIDVTRDERVDSNRMVGSDDPNAFPPRHIEDAISPEHIHPNYVEYIKKATDNVDLSRHPVNIGKLHWRNFLVSFLVDARGGAMRGCRHSGVRVIVPPRCAPSPTRITCRYVRPQRTPHPPPLMEGEALASRVLELGPVGAKFLGPVIIEVPHFAALRGKEREIVILRSDNGESWKEHTVEATEDVLNEVLRDSFEAEDLHQLEDNSSGRTTRIITQDFPQYFAVISRIRQEVHAIGPEGGMVSSTVVPQVQAVFPQGALTKKIKVGLQAQPIDPELTAKLLGHGVAVSPVVTVEPRRRKFHKAITLSMPAPRAHSQGMINQYSGSAPTLRLLCSITGGTSRAQWEDVTGSTPLTFVNDCVSFTTTVSARFWLMDCRNIGDATKMATELYREAIHVPFIAKFVVFAKRIDPLEARLRVFCMTDDKEDKTLEYQEQFTEIAKSRDVEVLEGKSQFIEFAGNLVPITKSGEQLQFSFRAFKENRLPFSVRVKDQHAEAVSRCLFMREPKVQKGEPPQQPICILNIVLPDDIVSETISLTDSDSVRKRYYANENFDYYRQDPRLADMSNLLGEDWVELANQLGLTSSEINVIKSEYPDSVAKQAQSMLRMWLSQSGNRVQTNTLENALRRIGRDDITNQCLNVDNRNQEILRIRSEEKEKHRLISENLIEDRPSQEKYIKEEKVTKTFSKNVDKYSAEEKTFEPSDEEEEDFNKSVPERREQIVKRLSTERTIPASSQRVEIVQEITSIKRQSLVEDKIAEVQQKANIEPMRITMVKPVSKIIQEKTISEKKESDITPHVEERIDKTQIDAQNTEKKKDPNINNLDNQEKPDRRDSVLLEEVTQLLETKKPVSKLANQEDPKSPKFSQTPPPSPADFIKEKQATTIQEWNAIEDTQTSSKSQGDTVEEDKTDTSCKELTEASQNFPTNTQPPQPKPRQQKSKEQIEEEPTETDIATKQLSPVRDDLLDDTVKTDDISYQDKKKFWENIAKEPSRKQVEVAPFTKRNSVQEIGTPPIPKPRGTLQSSYSIAETTTEKISMDDSILSMKDRSEPKKIDRIEETKITEIEAPEVISIDAQSKETIQEVPSKEVKKSESVETEDSSSQGGDNAGYISDSGDVEQYISDSEIEDRVPQIRERQMSVFVPPSVSQRTRYERSASLPTEDLYEVSARSTKLRKQYYEEQIKKEMIKEQLTIELEDEGSPERKSIASPEGKPEETSSVIPIEVPTNDREDVIFESEQEHEEDSAAEQQNVFAGKDETVEIHVDKSETEKSEKLIEIIPHAYEQDIISPSHMQDNIPEITYTLSGIQKRISEESEDDDNEKIPEITYTLSGIQKRISEESEDEDNEKIPEITYSLSGIQKRMSEESEDDEIIKPVLDQVQKVESDDTQEKLRREEITEEISDHSPAHEASTEKLCSEAESIKTSQSTEELKGMDFQTEAIPQIEKKLESTVEQQISELQTQQKETEHLEEIETQLKKVHVDEPEASVTSHQGGVKSSSGQVECLQQQKETEHLEEIETQLKKVHVDEPEALVTSHQGGVKSSSGEVECQEKKIEESGHKETMALAAEKEKLSTETILDDSIADIDLESEDLKQIVSRLESMHKFRKLKGKSSGIPKPIGKIQKVTTSVDIQTKVESSKGESKQEETKKTILQSKEEIKIADEASLSTQEQPKGQISMKNVDQQTTKIASEVESSKTIDDQCTRLKSPADISKPLCDKVTTEVESIIKETKSVTETVSVSSELHDETSTHILHTVIDSKLSEEIIKEDDNYKTKKIETASETTEIIKTVQDINTEITSEKQKLTEGIEELKLETEKTLETETNKFYETKINEDIKHTRKTVEIVESEFSSDNKKSETTKQDIISSEIEPSHEGLKSPSKEIRQMQLTGEHSPKEDDTQKQFDRERSSERSQITEIMESDIISKTLPLNEKLESPQKEIFASQIKEAEPSSEIKSEEGTQVKSSEFSIDQEITSTPNQSKADKVNSYTIINQPQENIENTVWEVSVESETLREEKLTSLPTSFKGDSAETKSDSISEKVNDSKFLDENTTDETNLESEKLDQERSDSLNSNKLEYDGHDDMKRIILESLHQQKVDPEEARMIANSLIEEIESEIQKVERFNRGLSSKSDSLESEKHVTDYLKELAESKGLDQREVELVESVLERRQRQISKLSRGDTQASSMEITDEDLRYSETDYDYSNVLQQQMGQLEAEYSDHLKNVYDSLVEDQSSINTSVQNVSLPNQDDQDANNKNKDEQMRIEKTHMHQRDIILEEDENFNESSIDELSDLKTKPETTDPTKVGGENIDPLQAQGEVIISVDNNQQSNIHELIQQGEMKTDKIQDLNRDIQSQEMHTVEKYSTSEKEDSKESIKRTSSSDSKSSIGSSKTPEDLYSTCSSKKIDSETSSEVVFRKSKRHDDAKKVDRKSALDLEAYSSSGESHYHSFEIDNKSRPCSSDIEGILPTGSSEYESALNSQDLSMKSQMTSAEYHTAISSLSSKESMMSIESECSGNLASIEVSETSETLVPTNSDLEGDMDDQQMFDDSELWPSSSEFESNDNITEDQINQSLSSQPSSTENVDIPSKMKRSHEMTFQPEPKVPATDSLHTDPNDIEEKFGTSLDDASALSVSLSSTSSAQLRTVIELSRTESGGPEESLTSAFSEHVSLDDDLPIKYPENIAFVDSSTSTNTICKEPIESVTILSATITDNGVSSVCSQVTTEPAPSSEGQKPNHEELKKKGHRRQESTSFIPSLIHGVIKPSEPQTLFEIEQKTEHAVDAEAPTERIERSSIEKAIDLSIKRETSERRDSHGKSSSTSSEKSSFEEAEAEAAFNMVAHISPVHKIKQICPIIEDIDAEKIESEAKERAERARIERAQQLKDASPGSIPDIKVTEHMAPLDESNFRYPELEIEREELERENRKAQDDESPLAIEAEKPIDTEDITIDSLEDDECEIKEEPSKAPITEEKATKEVSSVSKNRCDDDRASDSPNSDSFELVDRPDIIDDFVVIEEIGKEASEMDSEGKSMAIQSKSKSHRKRDEEIDAYLARSDPTPLTKMTELKYFPDANYDLEFEFEDSPPQAHGDTNTKDYGSKYDKELEANRKWIEQQFHGDHAAMTAAGYGYEMEFERGPLEDIKEEDINDIDLASSRIGSLGSQKDSGGSGSVKDSYSSTPEYDVLAGRRYFTRSVEHDDISMSSLQEFENLERAMSLETKRIYHGSGSQESSSNGSFKTRYYSNKGQGDDISVSSLKEFEGLERACIAVYKTEIKVKEEEALLSHIDELKEILPTETETIKEEPIEENKVIDSTDKSRVTESDEEDYEKRMFEIDEIIRQAQNNVEKFAEMKEPEKTESLGRGDSIEEVSKVPDLDLDAPISKCKDDDPMVTSTDSLDLEQNKTNQYGSTDSLDPKNPALDIMTASTDSIEFNNQLSKNITTDSMDNKTEASNMVCSDSLDIAAAVSSRPQIDSLEEDEPKIFADHSSSDTGKDFSSSARDDVDEQLHELMLGSTDSLEPTSSTATHATYQYETDSVFSGSFTSGGSNTMVSSTDTIDPNIPSENVDIAAAVRKVWFDEGTSASGRNITTEFFEDSSMPYVTEVIEPSDDPAFSHTIHRRVQMPMEVRKVTFHGEEADKQLDQFIKDFGENEEEVHETEEIDADGNVHTRRVVQKRFIVRSGDEAVNLGDTFRTEGDKLTLNACSSQLTTITKTITGETSQPHEHSDTISSKAQAFRRRPLRYDISVDDQTEVDPREHDWLFYLNKDDQQESSTEEGYGQMRQQPLDQHQLSSEMKELLKEMEEASKK